jgi:hypothetical protein
MKYQLQPFIAKSLHVSSVRHKLGFGRSSIHNSRDVKKRLDRDRISAVVCRAAEGAMSRSSDTKTYLASFYTFHLKQVARIFIGRKIVFVIVCVHFGHKLKNFA